MSYNFAKIVRMRGMDAAIRQAKNLGLDFESTYIMMFNRLPRKEDHENRYYCRPV